MFIQKLELVIQRKVIAYSQELEPSAMLTNIHLEINDDNFSLCEQCLKQKAYQGLNVRCDDWAWQVTAKGSSFLMKAYGLSDTSTKNRICP